MAEEVGVFRFPSGRNAVLFPSADFSLAAVSDAVTVGEDPDGSPVVGLPEGSLPARPIEALLAAFFPEDGTDAEFTLPTVFFPRSPGDPALAAAWISRRDFEVITLPLDAFSLLPGDIRKGLARRGMAAARFAPSGGLEILIDADRAWRAIVGKADPE